MKLRYITQERPNEKLEKGEVGWAVDGYICNKVLGLA